MSSVNKSPQDFPAAPEGARYCTQFYYFPVKHNQTGDAGGFRFDAGIKQLAYPVKVADRAEYYFIIIVVAVPNRFSEFGL